MEKLEIRVALTLEEWLQIIERVEDDDFYLFDSIAQNAINKIKKMLEHVS